MQAAGSFRVPENRVMLSLPARGAYPFVAGVVVLALAIAVLWFVLRRADVAHMPPENFAPPEAWGIGVHKLSLGDAVDKLLAIAPTNSSEVVPLSKDIAFSPLRTTVMFTVQEATSHRVRIASTGPIVCQACFTADHFSLVPCDADLERAQTRNNVQIFRIVDSGDGTQAFDCMPSVLRRNTGDKLDMKLFEGTPSTAMTMFGVRAVLADDILARQAQGDGDFYTPEPLKRGYLAGVTMLLPSGQDNAIVAFRRFRERSGYILFGVNRTADGVVVRHIVFRRRRAPWDIRMAAISLSWDENGEYGSDVPPFHAVAPGVGGMGKSVEAIHAEELRRNMLVCTSVHVPMARNDSVIVEITPGRVRATSHPVNNLVESRVAQVAPFMSSPHSTWSSHPSRPLQMSVRRSLAIPIPCGDHGSLSRWLSGRT